MMQPVDNIKKAEITIEDVAKAANVSVSTVSRILNNKPDVSQRTRRRVLALIQELGYAPHAQAQRLAAGSSRTIALLFPADHRGLTQFELEFIVGAASAAGEENFFFTLVTAPMTAALLPGLYRSAQVDGLILMQIRMIDERVEFLRQQEYPFVMIGRTANNADLHFIDLDFAGAIVIAFDHLVALGHRQIALLGRPAAMRQERFGAAERILDGQQQACRKHNLEVIERDVELDIDATYSATTHLLQARPDLTAIVIPNGANTIGVIRAAEAAGRRVPTDLSVVAVATNKIAELLTPSVTAISFPTHTMGYQAAKMLIARLKGQPVDREQILLAPELVVRKSTSTVRQ